MSIKETSTISLLSQFSAPISLSAATPHLDRGEVSSHRASVRRMKHQLRETPLQGKPPKMGALLVYAAPFNPVVSPKFVIAKREVKQIGTGKEARYEYTLYTHDGQWIQFTLAQNDKRASQTSVGNVIRILEVTESKLKYGKDGFYLRYNIAFRNGEQIHVDGQIHKTSDQFDFGQALNSPQHVTNVVSEALVVAQFDGALYQRKIVGISLTITLEDGSVHSLKSNVHAYFDPGNPPSPIQKGDLVYVFDNSLAVVDNKGIIREIPL